MDQFFLPQRCEGGKERKGFLNHRDTGILTPAPSEEEGVVNYNFNLLHYYAAMHYCTSGH